MTKLKFHFIYILISASFLYSTYAATVIRAKQFLDVDTGRLIQPAVLVIDNQKIISIHPDQLPDNAEILELSGLTILSGLIEGPWVFPAGNAPEITGGHFDITGFASGIRESGPEDGVADGESVPFIMHGGRVLKDLK